MRALRTAWLLGAVAAMLLPVYVMLVVASAADDTDLGGLVFNGFHLPGNVAELFSGEGFPVYFRNSVLYCAGSGALDVLFSSAAGYALAQLSFPGRRVLFALVVGTLALAPMVMIIPVFLIVKELGWVNTFQGVIVPGMISAFGVFLVRQFALGLPKELIFAARVDGAGELRIFARVALPLLRPALVTLFLIHFLAQWDNLLWPLIVANDPSLWSLPVGLANFQSEHGFNYHLMTAAALVTAVPPFLLMAGLQRYYVAGLTFGGVK
ncbi:carbohydrate ABC transporter permease [Streptosporangium sp. G11]|jgi:multiple sugar transport system permease protein|uniref:carbohydrate ABC transporter permease n=1 Tax=Streptosporangium sp. G11 TaxID=3436926 RepID=UPI003EBAA5E0